MAGGTEKVVGLRDVNNVQSAENAAEMDNTNHGNSEPDSQGALTSFHILKMLEAAANRRSVNIVLVDEKKNSDNATEAPKNDMDVSLVLEVGYFSRPNIYDWNDNYDNCH